MHMNKLLLILAVMGSAGCVSSPERESLEPTIEKRMDDLTRTNEKFMEFSQAQYADRYREISQNSGKDFYTREETGGCSIFVGEGEKQKEIIPIVTSNLCETTYKYVVYSSLQCYSKGALKFPLKLRGKEIHWKLDQQRGTVTSDAEGKIRLFFASTQPIDINDKLHLFLEASEKTRLPNSVNIVLPEEHCGIPSF